jgi:DUF971 family protein
MLEGRSPVVSAVMESPVRIEVEPSALEIAWPDGSSERLLAAELRRSCPCAGCGTRPAPHPEDASITTARLVGDYAIAITFGPDGHATGIFPFDLLRTIGAPR